MFTAKKYRRFRPGVKPRNRRWPDKEIRRAPIWCGVDLRDGNQSIPKPMTVAQKVRFFKMLVAIGLKHIEVGFPSASETEFQFVRYLIEKNLIPDDVTIQVLVQAREDLIQRTVEAVRGAKRVIIHLYNSTSPAQREIVFGMEKREIVELALKGVAWVKQYTATLKGAKVTLEYSPESFSATEPQFALEVCEAVMKAWGATPRNKVILNLPATVEVYTPNVFADVVEWFCENLSNRRSAIISVHTHNDRGAGVAASELAVMAGADRVEGTLFGNGERTGNLDIVNMALNLLVSGVNPCLDFSDLPAIIKVYEQCTGMKVYVRQPYAGELVFTAFSGSHQDAIHKGLMRWQKVGGVWCVPYLPIDPTDVGRTYQEVVRTNGQSGGGGFAHVLHRDCGVVMPKAVQREFGRVAKMLADRSGGEVSTRRLMNLFISTFALQAGLFRLESDFEFSETRGTAKCSGTIVRGRKRIRFSGQGKGPIEALVSALNAKLGLGIKIVTQTGNAMGAGEDAKEISFVLVSFPDGDEVWGAGIDPSIPMASVAAIVSALNRKLKV